VCADDFGIAAGVSRAICELIEAERLSATSCMVVSPSFREQSRWLEPLWNKVDVGLHLTLTNLRPLSPMPRLAPDSRFPSLKGLMRQAFLRQLSHDEIFDEVHRQITTFEDCFGNPPDFIDGHHHVHLLPIVRDVVLQVAATRLGGPRYVRSCNDSFSTIRARNVSVAKSILLKVLGNTLRHGIQSTKLSSNHGFSGIYNFSDAIPYSELFERFLIRMGERGLIMCHPGHVDDELYERDEVVEQREREYEYLISPGLLKLLERKNYRIDRFSERGIC